MHNKLKIGWFSFSCCEDSTIVFTELLNDHFQSWSQLLDFQHVRILKSKNKLEGLDVAFVEGAIACKRDEDKLLEIRKNTKRLVAIGACANNGLPACQRNSFKKNQKEEIAPLVKKFKLWPRVKTLKEIVKVDSAVNGCPMNEEVFLKAVDKYLKEFNIIPGK